MEIKCTSQLYIIRKVFKYYLSPSRSVNKSIFVHHLNLFHWRTWTISMTLSIYHRFYHLSPSWIHHQYNVPQLNSFMHQLNHSFGECKSISTHQPLHSISRCLRDLPTLLSVKDYALASPWPITIIQAWLLFPIALKCLPFSECKSINMH